MAFPVLTERPMRETKNGRILDCLSEIGYRMVEEDLEKSIKIREEFTKTMKEFVNQNYEADQMKHFSLSSPRGLDSDAPIDPTLRDDFQEMVTSLVIPRLDQDTKPTSEEKRFENSKFVTSLVTLAVEANTWDTILREANWLTTFRKKLLNEPENYGFANRRWMGHAMELQRQAKGYSDKENLQHLIKGLPEDEIPGKKQKDTFELRLGRVFRMISKYRNPVDKVEKEELKDTKQIRRKFWISTRYWNALQHSLERPDWNSQANRAMWSLERISESFDSFLESPELKKDFLKTLQGFLKLHIMNDGQKSHS